MPLNVISKFHNLALSVVMTFSSMFFCLIGLYYLLGLVETEDGINPRDVVFLYARLLPPKNKVKQE